MNNSSAISFYVDTLLVETVLGNPKLIKTATSGVVSELLEKVKEYVSSHIDPNNKVESLANILSPGVVAMGFKALGLGWLGFLISIAMSVLHINVGSIISSIWGSLKGMLSGDKQVTSQQVDNIVQSAVQQEAPLNEQEKSELQTNTFDQHMRDARMLRFALEEYQRQTLRLTKENIILKEAKLSSLFGRKAKTTSLLTKILGWIFKVALASVGLLVAGDVVNKFIGRPNAIDGTYQAGKPSSETISQPKTPLATQTKFPFKNDSPIPFMIPLINSNNNIENLIIQWAKDTYSGLDGKEHLIQNSPGFKIIKDRIVWYNARSEGDQGIYIPKNFATKRSLVDLFIDDVAKNA